jgi:hypothetical protein
MKTIDIFRRQNPVLGFKPVVRIVTTKLETAEGPHNEAGASSREMFRISGSRLRLL